MSSAPEKPRMKQHIDELLARIETLQNELEEEYRQAREDWEQRKQELADEFLRQQRRYKTGLFRFCCAAGCWSSSARRSSTPAGFLLLIDLFVTTYQAICFPIYRIPKVKRSDYLVFDRADLPYLNAIEKFNCFYCSYGNGVAAYFREVAARTEQYWCPIKHARRVRSAHDRYPKFFDYGDAEAFQQGLSRLRKQYDDVAENRRRGQ
jgi:hypothetical protein